MRNNDWSLGVPDTTTMPSTTTTTSTTTVISIINSTLHNHTTNATLSVNSNGVILKELQLVILSVLLLTGLFLNTALILLFVTRRRAATRHSLLLNLALSNGIACVFILPRLIFSVYYPDPNEGVRMPCNVLLTITEAWWITQNYTLVVISYGRWKKVARPFREHARVCQRSVQYILVIWGIAVSAIVIILLSPWITCRYDKTIFRCRKLWENHTAYSFIYPVISFWIPGFLLTYFYVSMFYKSCQARMNEPRLFSSRELPRSWSLTSLASLRDFIGNVNQNNIIRRLGRSESLPGGLDAMANMDRERSASFSGRASRAEGSDYSGHLSRRKLSLTNTPLKSIISTLLILIPYFMASIPELVLIYLYSEKTYTSRQSVDVLSKSKYILVAWFPFILVFLDRELKKELRRMYQRLRCWRSGQVSPIDNSDYPENFSRRESRRGSMISRRNSVAGMSEDPSFVGALSHSIRDAMLKKNSNPLTGLNNPGTYPLAGLHNPGTCNNRGQIFYLNSPINMPVVDV